MQPEELQPVLGAIESLPDYRKLKYSDVASLSTPEPLPETYSTDTSFAPVFNQKQTPSCVSHAFAKLMQIWWYKKTGEIVEFSPRFLDILSGQVDNLGINDGRRPATVAKIANKMGCCTTATLPNNTDLSNSEYRDGLVITSEIIEEAAKYKIPGYAFIDLNDYEIRHAIYHHGGVALLFQVGKELWTPSRKEKDLNPLRTPAVVVSGHEMLGKGWKVVDETLLNSWGNTWCRNGEADYNFTKWRPYLFECIAIVDPNLDWQKLIKDLPPPTSFKYEFKQKLSKGMHGDDVKALQTVLIMEECLKLDPSIGLGYFGDMTFAAVIKLQEKYFDQILKPVNLTSGTGYVGTQTLKFLNSKYSK